ncbi:two pore domain potassium channel family protein [Streptomyces sp. CAI-21]|uniref:potassium channel family protein n=1 Tax=Streptomyces TaxID=1883 RepID=UPI00099B38B6|nr:potassium channel family protein [Streptomyces albidoflavus]NUW09994.1 two pore domain potassium channel family protein [Streptomyces sp. CAI-21]
MTSAAGRVSPGRRPGRAAMLGAMSTRLARWENRTELPLAAASLVFLASYALRVLGSGLPPEVLDACLALLLGCWLLFAVDYAVRWRLSGEGPFFWARHGLDTAVLLLPLLRPLRVVPVYEAVRRRHRRPRLNLYARVMSYASLAALLLGFAGALTVYAAERSAEGSSIQSFGDAVWCVCATLATIGYGDAVPVTFLGRLVLVALMAGGLALLGAVTGSFASWLLQAFAEEGERAGRPPAS